MQQEENLNLKLEFAPGESQKLLVIRHDEPLPHREPTPVTIEGIITTPSEFLAKRGDQCDPKKCYVIFSKKGLSITFVVNESDHFKTRITGTLKLAPFLKGLKINSDSGYTIKELAAALKFQRMHFKNKVDHKNLMFTLENFTAKVETVKGEANDHKGDKKKFVNEKIVQFGESSNLDFVLLTQIFEGGPKVEVPIRVDMEPRDGDVNLFLMYDELEEDKESAVEEIFTTEMEKFKEFPVIEKD